MEFSFNIQKNSLQTGTMAQYVTGLGVKRINILSETDYQAIASSDSKTLYLVQNKDKFKLYLGNISLCVDNIPADTEQELKWIAEEVISLKSATENRIVIQTITKEEYDSLDNPDENVLYIVK